MEGKVGSLLFLFLLLIPLFPTGESQSSGHLLIYEVSPYPYPNTHMEYICIYNPQSEKIDLKGYYLTDFEGNLELKGKIEGNSKIYIAENATAFYNFMGFYPDFTYSQLKKGDFALANNGDEVSLFKNGSLLDIVIYGSSKYRGIGWQGKPLKITEGHILRRIGYEDSDSWKDWKTYHIIGQSDIPPKSFEVSMEIFPYPDEWRELIRFVTEAENYIYIETYTLDSYELGNALLSKLDEGVKVVILLEGSPVGGMNDYEKYIVHQLWDKGAEIKFMVNSPKDGICDRYRFVHSKFIIRDGWAVLISTENFGHSSLSPCGNRGYGIIVRDEKFTKYIERMFLDDAKDVQDIRYYQGEFSDVKIAKRKNLELREKRFRSINLSARILPIIAPDFAEEYFKRFLDEQKSVDIEALYIDDDVWKEISNKVHRILVESSDKERIGRIFNGKPHYIRGLHAKLIIGNSGLLVGSMNLGISSMENNRELSLWIANKKAIEYLNKIFDYDWRGEYAPKGVMNIKIDGERVQIDLSKSKGEIEEYRVYIDGNLVYEGRNRRIKCTLKEGTHTVRAVLVDRWGNVDVVEGKININKRGKVDIRIFVSILIFAVFFYKVWKAHR